MISEIMTKQYCCEDISKIENYAQAVADKTQMWQCHHRLEVQGQFTNSRKLLIKCGMYYNVPASQLIFVTQSMHNKIHDSAKKMLEKRTPEQQSKISKAGGEATKGKKWWNNGVNNKRAFECPDGYVPGMWKKNR